MRILLINGMRYHIILKIAAALFSVIAITYPTQGQVYEPIPARKGMVVCTEPTAAQVGVEILRKGGNAIDAAIATAFALAVTYPSCGNIGGGGFLTYYERNGNINTIDFRITAPLSASEGMYLGPDGKKINDSLFNTIQAAGVPGTVAGLELAHKRYGSLPWADLISPSVKLARDGFPLHQKLFNEIKNEKQYLLRYPSSREIFLRPDSSSFEIGEIIKQPDLARTLERIQKGGANEFYRGKTAELLVRFVKKNNGFITAQDLLNYQAVERKPVHGNYRGYDIYSVAPPSSGGIIIIEALNVLEHYNLKQLGHNSAEYLHLLSKAFKNAYDDREKYISDPAFVKDIPVERLISKEYANEIVKDLANDRFIRKPKNDSTDSEKKETTHFSVVDSKGNAVSFTYTLDGDFGSYGIVEGAGFLLNNEMQSFDMRPKDTNVRMPDRIEPGKRPRSSMSPTIIMKDGKLKYILGTPGGPAIPSTLVQIIANLIDFDMNLAEAISAKRIFGRWRSDEIYLEKDGVTKDTKELLEKMGHKVEITDWRCNTMCIEVDGKKNLYYGVADPRSLNGVAIGY
jgi:gamma-glutamyltranspeptidase/glutathione hydrolase